MLYHSYTSVIFFFTDPATTEIYTLSLHDALPILPSSRWRTSGSRPRNSPLSNATAQLRHSTRASSAEDRKSTRLNSSHSQISYAVFCLKKKKKETLQSNRQHRQRQEYLQTLLRYR